LLHRPIEDAAAALAAARTIYARGVQFVIVTMSGDGAVAVTPDAEYRVQIPKLEVVSAVGAGDAFLSGLLCGLVKQYDWQEALRLAGAAGAAACLTPGTVLCSSGDVWRLRPTVRVERVRAESMAG
jgi:fructose-1-phosphate kinase PfkB-like protein